MPYSKIERARDHLLRLLWLKRQKRRIYVRVWTRREGHGAVVHVKMPQRFRVSVTEPH